VPDKFEDFIRRLERPIPEPKMVGMVDKAVDVQIACMGFACSCIWDTMSMAVKNMIVK
jgi:hypothetical protein